MSLINKTIKIKNLDILSFFYPGYVKRTTISIADKDLDVIFVGEYDKNLLPRLIKGTKSFINTVGPHNVDLSDYSGWVRFVSEAIGKKEPPDKIYKNMSEHEFFNWLKLSYMEGKWRHLGEGASLFNYFKTFSEDIASNIRTLIETIDSSSDSVTESGFLTFLGRVNSLEEQAVSPAYLKLLTEYSKQFPIQKIQSVIKETYSKGLKPSLRMLDFILELRCR